jgi:putative ABC transport system ATP-binding protein
MTTTDIVLDARGLSRRFGDAAAAVDAVRDLDLTVHAGEIVLIMGPSGSGKTTLLTMLGGLLRPSGGTIAVDGHDLTALSESQLPALRAQSFGFIFQDFNLMPSLTARENVEIALNIAGVRGAAAHEHAGQLLERLGLGERIGFLPEQLSGGEKQRVAIARALANEPALILADEPTANLDSHHGREVMRELRRIAKDEGRSVVIVSHDERLKDIADRVLWLEDGRFSREDELVADPVCGMSLERAQARYSLESGGSTYWFCCAGCQQEFVRAQAPTDAGPAGSGAAGPSAGDTPRA